jgi:RsiW-degrading membrane proteinase PrsW (M82 family)
MLEIASIFLGIVPMVVFAILIWRIDCWETEPLPLVVGAFLWGAVPSIIFAVMFGVLFTVPMEFLGIYDEKSFFGLFYTAGILAPLSEEFAKGVGVLLVFVTLKKHIHSILDGVIYGSVVGFGFSAIENTSYFLTETSWNGLWQHFQGRAIDTGLSHSIFTGATGAGMALGLFSSKQSHRYLWPLAGFGAAVFLHFTHNTLVVVDKFTESGIAGILLYLINNNIIFIFLAIIIYCLYREFLWISLQLDDEARADILTYRQAGDAASLWHRTGLVAFEIGFSNMLARRKLLKTATKLAYSKQHCQLRSIPFSSDMKLQRLRQEVKFLSPRDPLIHTDRDRQFEPQPPPLPPARYIPPPLP